MPINQCPINSFTINSICDGFKPYINIILGIKPDDVAGAQHNGFVFSAYNSVETNFARVERDPEDDNKLVIYDAHNVNFELNINGETINVTFDKADPNFKPFVQVKNLSINKFDDVITIEIQDIKVS